MREKRKIQTAGILFLCLSLLTGCARTEHIKTIVLDDPVKTQAAEEQRTDGYQVKKIYTWEYAAPTPQSVSLLGCDEHEMRLASVEEDGGGVQFDRLDYRYGFYEDYGKTSRERLAIYDRASEEKKQFMRNALSPDGRFLLWLEEESSGFVTKMYLNNLETGEDELLLDGYALKCPKDEYFPLMAWSRDGKYLAYCFFPKTEKAYNSKRESLVTILNVETREIVGQYIYNKSAGTDMLRLNETELYLDVSDGKALTVVAENLFADKMTRLEISSFEIKEQSGEEQLISYSSARMEPEGTIYPDAETGKVYVEKNFGRIYEIEAETGSYGEGALIELCYENAEENGEENGEIFHANRTIQFLVLDKGDTLITTERAETGHDICIYQRKGEDGERTWERRILYHYNAGALYFLQYDEINHRLLAISSAFYIYGVNQTAIVLEF